MYDIAVLGQITWVDLGGLVVATTALLFTIFGVIFGFVTKIMFNKLDIMTTNIKLTNDLCIANNSEIRHLNRNHEECKDDREGLHKRVTESQGGV